MKFRPDEFGLYAAALLLTASLAPLGLPDPVNISLGVAALVTMIGSLLYGRLARQRWTDRPGHQGIDTGIRRQLHRGGR